MKFLGRPFWLMAVFVFTTKKLPIPDGLSASLKTDSTAALRTVADTSPPRHLPDKRSSIQHSTQVQTAPYSNTPILQYSHTPTRRHADTPIPRPLWLRLRRAVIFFANSSSYFPPLTLPSPDTDWKSMLLCVAREHLCRLRRFLR